MTEAIQAVTEQIAGANFQPNAVMMHPRDYQAIKQRLKNRAMVNRLRRRST